MSTSHEAPTVVSFGEDVLERMVLAVEKVRERLRRAATALDAAGIPYAVIGGNAVAAWVSKVDPGAARNTVDVDLMVNRRDLDGIKAAMKKAGFVHHELMDVHMFLDGPDGRPRDAVHMHFAGDAIGDDASVAAFNIDLRDRHQGYCILALEPLVEMKLTSFRSKDRMHLRDLIDVELVDHSWLSKLPPVLAARLQELLDNPDG